MQGPAGASRAPDNSLYLMPGIPVLAWGLAQLPFDVPHQGFALVLVGLHRLPVDHLVDLGIAVFIVVPLGTARVVFIEILVRVVDAVTGEVSATV